MKETEEKKENSLFSKITSFKTNKWAKRAKKDNIEDNKKVISSVKSYTLKEEQDEILKKNKNSHIVEYYDLPYRYNQTAIKILAQTPHSIFIYWDLSDTDRQNMIKMYGDNFFNETKPVLLVHNKTLNYSFEVEIDDFTNSWYLHTPTSDCVFDIELGRKNINSQNNISFNSQDNALHITTSNNLQSQNDHVLIDTLKNPVHFRNIKTGEVTDKKVTNLDNIKHLYNIDSFYTDEEFKDNPTSGFRI